MGIGIIHCAKQQMQFDLILSNGIMIMTQQEQFTSGEYLMNFDTHKSFKAIVAAGFSNNQAEALVNLVQASKEYDLSKLATKEQLKNLEQKMHLFEQRTDDRFASLENKIDSINTNLNNKIDSVNISLNNKIDFINESLNNKMESGFSRLETLIFKQDSQQKIFLISTLLTVIGISVAILIKLG